MNTNIPIVPKTVSTNITYNKLDIIEVTVVPFTSARVSVSLSFTESENILSPISSFYKTIEMTTEEYLQWLNDDSFLISFVLSKLGLTKA